MWTFGLWRLEGGAFSGVRLEAGRKEDKKIRGLEGEKIWAFGLWRLEV